IQPVRVGDELMVSAIFRQLLYASMQKSHDRRGLDNPLSFQFQNYFQDAVSAGVLRAHVEEQLLSPKGWQGRTLRMSRVHLIHGAPLVFIGVAALVFDRLHKTRDSLCVMRYLC